MNAERERASAILRDLGAARGKGVAVGSVLLIATIALVAAFSMAAIVTANLNLASRDAHIQDAQYLAEAAIAQVIYAVRDDNRYGVSATTYTYQPDPNDGTRQAVVTFDKSRPSYSTNNIAGNNATGYGTVPVPAGAVRLMAIGSSAAVTRTVDVLLTAPPYPYAISADGPITCTEGLVVSRASSMADFAARESGASQACGGASIGCNSDVTAQQTCNISGDVVAAGTVSLPPDSVVGGAIRQGAIDIPTIDSSQWDPRVRPGASQILVNSDLTPAEPLTVLVGSFYTASDLVVSGDLNLDSGLLYVNGNLTISGGITGYGAVIVRGTTTLGGASLSSSNLVALVSEGDITFTGDATTRKYFQGLVYAHGCFTASNITIAGVFVARQVQSQASSGAMTLRNVRVTYTPEAATMSITASLLGLSMLSGYLVTGQYSPTYSVDTKWGGDGSSGRVNVAPIAYNAVIKGLQLSNESLPGSPAFWYDGTQQRLYDPTHSYYVVAQSWEPTALAPARMYQKQIRLTTVYERWARVVVSVDGLEPDPVTHRIKMRATPGVIICDEYGRPCSYDPATVEAMKNFALDLQSRAVKSLESIPIGGETLDVNLVLNRYLNDAQPFRIVSWKVR